MWRTGVLALTLLSASHAASPGEVQPGGVRVGEVRPGDGRSGVVGVGGTQSGGDRGGEARSGESRSGSNPAGEAQLGRARSAEDRLGQISPARTARGSREKRATPTAATARAIDRYLQAEPREAGQRRPRRRRGRSIGICKRKCGGRIFRESRWRWSRAAGRYMSEAMESPHWNRRCRSGRRRCSRSARSANSSPPSP